MSEWVVVGKAQNRRKPRPRKKQSDDDEIKHVAQVAKDVEALLRSADLTWTPEQIQEALQYPSMFDIWHALDKDLLDVVDKKGKHKYFIKN